MQVIPKPILFGPFVVTSQVFHITPHSYAFVNLKPILPGHVLVSPHRVVPRLADLTSSEIADLFITVQRVGRVVTRIYGAAALNVAVQDGTAAGQSVPHVHAHIIPRQVGDFGGNVDEVYAKMQSKEADLGEGYRKTMKLDAAEERKPRSDEDMNREAKFMKKEMENTEN